MYFQIMQFIDMFYNDEKGAELAEYGLVLALVAVLAIAALGTLSGGINNTLSSVGTTLGG